MRMFQALMMVVACMILAFQATYADEYFNDLAALVAFYEDNPQADGYVIMIDEGVDGDFDYVFIEVDNEGNVNIANNFDSNGNLIGVDPSSSGQSLGDYVENRGLTVQGPPFLIEPNCPNSPTADPYF